MTLNWANPGPAELAATEDFVQSDEAREVRPPPLTDSQPLHAGGRHVVSSKAMARKALQVPVVPLETILREVLSSNFSREAPNEATPKGWDDLTESLLAAEKTYEDQTKDRWRRIWYGLGDKADVVTPWIELIPNEYGLAIVKTSVAVILKLAKNSRQKREKILQAFEEIQRAMKAANPLKGVFQSNDDVKSARDKLHGTIVDSVNDMLLLTAKKEHSWHRAKKGFGQRAKDRDIDSILQLLSDKTRGLKEAIENAQHGSIESIDVKTTYTAVGTAHVLRGVSHLDGKVDLQGEQLRTVIVALQEQNSLLMALLEAQSNKKDEIAVAHLRKAGEAPPSDLNAWYIHKLENMLFTNKRDAAIQENSTHETPRRRRKAIINEWQFFEAIADPVFHEDQDPDIKGFIAQPDEDWSKVIGHRGDDDSKTQSHARSILHQRRFIDWMKGKYPDLVLVLADLPHSGMENITAVSVFCATLITSLTNLRREDAVLYFFCGLHVDPHDPSPGPRGLLRSLIVQLFSYLTRTGQANLDFIDNREYVRNIEDQNLGALCQTLCELLWQCESGTYVYCIIDSVTLFERTMWFRDLKVVGRCLQDCVEDMNMPGILKIMLTSSALCTPELKDLFTDGNRYPEAVLYLSAENHFAGDDFDGEEMEHQLGQMAVGPQPSRPRDLDRRYRQRYEE